MAVVQVPGRNVCAPFLPWSLPGSGTSPPLPGWLGTRLNAENRPRPLKSKYLTIRRPFSWPPSMQTDTRRIPADLPSGICLFCHWQIHAQPWPSSLHVQLDMINFPSNVIMRQTKLPAMSRHPVPSPPSPLSPNRLVALISWACMNRLERSPDGERRTAVPRMLQRLARIGICCTFHELSRALPQHFDGIESTSVAVLTVGMFSQLPDLRARLPVLVYHGTLDHVL